MTLRSQIIWGLLVIQAIIYGLLIRFLANPLGATPLNAKLAILLAFADSLFLSVAFLIRILRPLKSIQSVAKAFSEQRFETIADIPKTDELRQLVISLNDASRRLLEMQEDESRRIDIFRREAFEDSVTGLDNRRGFDLRFRNLLGSGGNPYEVLQLVILEIDGLKEYNIQSGYQAGDELLVRLTKVVTDFLDGICTISARINGGSFCFVCPNSSEEDLLNKLKLLIKDISTQGVLPPEIQLNVGTTSFSAGETASAVLARADVAVESSRQSRGKRIRFANARPNSAQPNGSLEWRRVIEDALQQEQWTLMLQPVYNFDGSVIHHEIMGRLIDSSGNVLKASHFIPMAQRHNLAVAVDQAIITQAVHFVSQVITDGENSGIAASVNVSPQSISDPAFIEWLEHKLTEMGEMVSLLSFEISEIGARQSEESVLNFKQTLKKYGIALGLDHFGLAPQSANMLRQILPDYVKIDSGLTQEVEQSSEARHLLASLVQLAHSLNIRVIAQNIESDNVIPILKEEKVDGGQGYFFGRPGSMLKAA